MKRNHQRCIMWMLVLMMVLVLTACGGTDASEPVTPDEAPAETPAKEPAEVEEITKERGESFPGADLVEMDADLISEMQENVRTLQGVQEATENGEVIGYVILVTPTSYGGPMEVFTAIDVNGTIVQVDIGEHEDSPGIGTQVENPQYLNRYNGIDSPAGITEVDGIAGATMTSGGVKDGVNRAYTIFESYLQNN